MLTASERQALIDAAGSILNDNVATPEQKIAAIIDIFKAQLVIS